MTYFWSLYLNFNFCVTVTYNYDKWFTFQHHSLNRNESFNYTHKRVFKALNNSITLDMVLVKINKPEDSVQ